MKKQFLVEFNSKSTSMSGGAKDVLNRVMPKDNIAIGMMLEVVGSKEKQEVFVWNAHLTWDPEFCDVKVVQSVILLHEVDRNLKESGKKGAKPCVIIGGDFNSELDSGVYEYMDKGKIAKDHKDFKGYDFSAIFDKVCSRPKCAARTVLQVWSRACSVALSRCCSFCSFRVFSFSVKKEGRKAEEEEKERARERGGGGGAKPLWHLLSAPARCLAVRTSCGNL